MLNKKINSLVIMICIQNNMTRRKYEKRLTWIFLLQLHVNWAGFQNTNAGVCTKVHSFQAHTTPPPPPPPLPLQKQEGTTKTAETSFDRQGIKEITKRTYLQST